MLWAIVGASALLLVGVVLRAKMRALQWLFVPASVIGGIVGLVLVQAGSALDPVAAPVEEIAGVLRGWPGPLIAVVFAGLLLEQPTKPLEPAFRGAIQAGIMVWIIVLGQVALGLAAAWALVLPTFDVPPAFGQLLEAGFAGGHGTATALGTIFGEILGFPAGLDLGLFIATIGLLYSVVSGILFVNIGVRRGWTRSGRAEVELIGGLEARHDPRPMARARVRGEVVDPFAFQLVIVALAVGVGALMQQAFVRIAAAVAPADVVAYLENVPLFLFTLLGGWAVRGAMRFLGVDDLIDGESIKRIVAIAMEFLIVAAVASLRIEVIGAYLWPLLLLCGVGFAWTAVCLVVISRRILPREHWFELGILNYGMSTGTTAQGMMLLRIIDRDLESGAAEDYALAAPLSAPFIGGGVITMTLPLLLQTAPIPVVVATIAVIVTALYLVGRRLNR